MNQPRCTVFESKYVRGWDGDASTLDDHKRGHSLAFKRALKMRYPTDAHASQWVIPGVEKPPRLRLDSLRYFDLQAEDAQWPELRSVFIDIDFPDHGEESYGWDNRDEWPGEYERWRERIEQAFQRSPELRCAAVYQTRGGMRFCWPLPPSRWLQVPKAGSWLDQFYDYLIEDVCLPCDRLKDWTRFFRLPAVNRDGKDTEPNLTFDRCEPLDWKAPEPLVSSIEGSGSADREEMPDPDNIDTPTKSDLKDLEDRWYWHSLYHGHPISDPGDRHNSLLRAAASIASRRETTDPLEIFQLIIGTVESMDEDFTYEEAWDLCVWVCEREDAYSQKEDQSETSFLEDQAEAMDCDPQEVRSRLILYTTKGGTYYLWDEVRQEYAVKCSETTQIYPLLHQHCPRLSEIIDAESTDTKNLLVEYGRSIARTVYSYIRDEHELDEYTRTLYVPVLNRDPRLEPTYHEDVHGWLTCLFSDHVENGLDWLASFLRFERQTCALYLDGPPNIGKSLLANGIARIWQTSPTEYAELMDDFQSALLESPLIHADENVPGEPWGESGSSLFRRVTGRNRQKISEKFVDKSDLEGALRVLITANDSTALDMDEQLGPDDIAALQQRIGYIETDGSAHEKLLELKDRKNADAIQDFTQEWVEGGKIAEHVLWLNEHREVEIGDRYLVEGWESDLTSNLVFQIGAAEDVMRFIITAIRDRRKTQAVAVDDEGIWLHTGRATADYRRVVSGDVAPPGHNEAVEVVRSLSDGRQKKVAIEEDGRVQNRRFWRIDPEDVLNAAEFFQTALRSELEKAIEQRRNESRETTENVEALDEMSI